MRRASWAAPANVEPSRGLLEVLLGDQRILAPAAVVDRLLGMGSGLTPSGDDILAGFLVGAWSFGLVDDQLRTAVLEAAPAGTTDLSAALLRCACRGESIPQVSALLSALSGATARAHGLDDALLKLCRVGHSSGVSMAFGVVAAAKVAAGVRRKAELRRVRQLLAETDSEAVPYVDRGNG